MESMGYKFKGVSVRISLKGIARYRAHIHRDGRSYSVGSSKNIFRAAALYNDAADAADIKGVRNLYEGKLLSINSKDEEIQELIRDEEYVDRLPGDK